jgi:hypothetical protein
MTLARLSRSPLTARVAATILAGLSSACIPQGVPRWAMHVQPAEPDPDADEEELAARLSAELAQRQLEHGHTAPEEIATVAVRELRRGRLADAGLWLSLASYRYHQEAIEAIERGEAEFQVAVVYHGVPRAEYQKLVLAEIQRFAELGFEDELDVISDRVYGHDQKEAALQDQLTTLGKTEAIDREALRDLWSELRPKSSDAVEPTHFPALTDAFRIRLRNDAAAWPDDLNPVSYLARTPVAALKRDAIYATRSYFEPAASQAISEAFPQLRPAMVKALQDTRPQARAIAAAALALAPTADTRPMLEARLAVETSAKGKLVLEWALAVLGAPEHLLPVTTALAACKGEACALPTMLLQWLPMKLKKDLDQAPLARIVANKQLERRTRVFAVAALRSIGHETPLTPGAIDALVQAAHFKPEGNSKLQVLASQAVQETSTLSRTDVLARLESRASTQAAREDAQHPCALLARLARVSLAEDVPLLTRLMNHFGESEAAEPNFIVEAALNVRTAEADAALIRWYKQHVRVRTQIAMGLVGRDSVPRDQLRRLVVGDARAQIAVKAMLHDPDTQQTLLAYLQSQDIDRRFQAAEMAGLIGDPGPEPYLQPLLRFSDARYYPNDALIRHAAMTAIVRLSLARTKPAAPVTGAPPAGPTAAQAATAAE